MRNSFFGEVKENFSFLGYCEMKNLCLIVLLAFINAAMASLHVWNPTTFHYSASYLPLIPAGIILHSTSMYSLKIMAADGNPPSATFKISNRCWRSRIAFRIFCDTLAMYVEDQDGNIVNESGLVTLLDYDHDATFIGTPDTFTHLPNFGVPS